MKKEASLEEWKNLYEIAIKIKESKPWDDPNNMEFMEVKDVKKTNLCNIVGLDELFYGIVIYSGERAIDDFLYSVANHELIPFHQQLRYQNSLICHFADRKELSDKDYKLIKDLGIKFRGKKEWIFFRAVERDHDMGALNREEVLEFTKVLEQVYEGILDNKKNKVKCNEEEGELLVRFFDKKRKVWRTQKGNFNEFEYSYAVPCLSDEILMKRMKKAKYIGTRLELDIVSVPIPENPFAKNGERQPILSIATLADIDKEMMISDEEAGKSDEERVEAVFDRIIPYILNEGKPEMILVRDECIGSLVLDICNELDIDLRISPSLKVIDDYVTGFLGGILEDELEELFGVDI